MFRGSATADGDIPTRFDDADLVYFRPSPTDPDWSGGTVLRDVRSRECVASPESAFAAVCSVGGDQGWFSGEWLWRIRGVMDQLVSGPGLRRGRRKRLAIDDALDFWRIEELVPPRRLRLHAEMRLPGEARLTWDVVPTDTGSGITQTALFRPRGLLGRAYWLAVAPFHRFVFPGLLADIVSLAEKRQRDPGSN